MLSSDCSLGNGPPTRVVVSGVRGFESRRALGVSGSLLKKCDAFLEAVVTDVVMAQLNNEAQPTLAEKR